jgi:RHS repeat-associated protein
MPRGSTTQTRTFNYTTSNVVGAFLLSATNPENGTVSYTYNSTNTLASKTDAKGNQLTYQYDSYNRLTSVTWANAPAGAQVLRTYYYDTNPLDSTGFSQNTAGRLTAVQYANVAQNPDVGSTPLPIQMNDMYSYTASTAAGAGLPSAKRLQVNQMVYYKDINNQTQHKTVAVNLDSTSIYNNEGKLTAMTYPSTINGSTSTPGASYNYTYDSMYRLSTMTTSGSATVVNGVSYNAANQLLGMTYNGISETRGYNVLNQLTTLSAQENLTTIENLTYTYPTGTNNGKISSMSNALSGETISYTYDSLNRMVTASDSIGQTVQWAEGYTFDPFGNLTTKHVTAGSGPSLSVSVNPANNQIEGLGGYDANGNAYMANAAYDVENRIYALVGVSPYTSYSYDAQGKRTFMWGGTSDSNNNPTSYSVVAYSASGQKLGTYLLIPGAYYSGGNYVACIDVSVATSDQYFGGRRLAVQDQLGSAGTYYPWGEAKGSTNPQDTWSFASYWRDSATGLDYANNRYYSNAYGRFMTPDPYASSGGASDPQSWNRYAYTRGDPVNRYDPAGTDDCGPGWETDASLSGPCESIAASTVGYPGLTWSQIFVVVSAGIEQIAAAQQQTQDGGAVPNCSLASGRYNYYCLTTFGPDAWEVQGDLMWIAGHIDPNCAAFLSGPTESLSSALNPLDSAVATFFYTGTFVPAIGVVATTLDVAFNIIVNRGGDFFSGAFADQILFLLHEVAHVTGTIQDGFVQDDTTNGVPNAANGPDTALVAKECQQTIAAAGGN